MLLELCQALKAFDNELDPGDTAGIFSMISNLVTHVKTNCDATMSGSWVTRIRVILSKTAQLTMGL